MLPDGVVKGGSAIKMRYGNARTRYTTDLDTATASDPASYAEELGRALSRGWEGFTGQVVARRPARPRNVPEEYVMQPFDVRLSYLGKPWCTVPLEVGHNEIGDTDAADWAELADAAEAFGRLGFPAPGRVPLMPLEHQIAQKLHALTGGGDRVRDLVDLQKVFANLGVPQARQALAGSNPCDSPGHEKTSRVGGLVSNGGPAGVRTLDLGIKSPLLYQLSYRSLFACKSAKWGG